MKLKVRLCAGPNWWSYLTLQSYRLPHPASEKKGNPRFGLEVYHDANWLERPMLPLLGTQNVYSPELSRRL